MGLLQFNVKLLHSQSVRGLASVGAIVLVGDWGDLENSNGADGQDLHIGIIFADFLVAQIPLNC